MGKPKGGFLEKKKEGESSGISPLFHLNFPALLLRIGF
jgi:hypothetical protein